MRVKFIITKILNTRKSGSDIKLNTPFIGDLTKRSDGSQLIYYVDQVNCEWVFFVNSTCTLLPLK